VGRPAFEGDQALPTDPERNTAGRALLAMTADLGLEIGFRVRIEKGIPLGSGMGGSASSAVGAVVAANALLDSPQPKDRLLRYALAGEAVASGAAHAAVHGDIVAAVHGDNVAPCLYGGLCCFLPTEPPEVIEIRLPSEVWCVLVRPRLRQDTVAQRALLAEHVRLEDFVRQSAHLAAFISACHCDDLELLRRAMRDLVIAPQRFDSIPGGAAACAAARTAGALGASIAGSGPSLFAWVEGESPCAAVRDGMVAALASHEVAADVWIGPPSVEGARILGPS